MWGVGIQADTAGAGTSGGPLDGVQGDVVNAFPEAEAVLHEAAAAMVASAVAVVKADIGGTMWAPGVGEGGEQNDGLIAHGFWKGTSGCV